MISDLRLRHFRSYADESFEFADGVNIIVGPNGSGKTNLLEALLVAARGSSYRAKDAELMRFGTSWTRLEATSDTSGRVVKLEASGQNVRKRFELGGQIYQRLSQANSLPVVLFEPTHLRLLAGPPELRRNFLDNLLEQTTPGYAATRRHFHRALTQRNALLKQGVSRAKPQMFAWNIRLSELAGIVAAKRRELVANVNQSASHIYQQLSGSSDQLAASYQSRLPETGYESALLRTLETRLERDCALGFTSAGPHRDDLLLELAGHPSAVADSRGESRGIILTLKAIELWLLAEARQQTPLLLLDDVFSELDGRRRQALTKFLEPYQTFITTTDADVVLKHFTDSCRIIPLP
jgi:DNA replication and repair protein RecF